MNNTEFLNEVLTSNICPHDFRRIYKDFEQYQQDAIKTLVEFHRLCEENRILYQLAYGSLLGAIRDNGQIPWDYDIDVYIPYSEKDHLIQVLIEKLDAQFYFDCPDINPRFPSYMIRISPKGYHTEAVHVDVFYVIGAPEQNIDRNVFKERVKRLCIDRARKLRTFKNEPQKDLALFFVMLAGKIRRIRKSLGKIEENLEIYCNKYDAEKTGYVIAVCTVYKNILEFENEKFWDTKIIKTNIGELRVTKYYEEILRYIYGNYNEVLPLDSRVQEVLHYHKLLKAFDIMMKL